MSNRLLTKTQVIHRIKEIIDLHCYLTHKPDSGCYVGEIYADYRDCLEDATIKKMFDSSNPMEAFDEIMNDGYMTCVWDYEDELFETIRTHFDDDDSDYCFDSNEDMIREWVYDHVRFDFPYSHYLKQKVEVDVMVDTGDGNYDFVLNCTYPHYNGRRGETVSDEAAIVWLAKQQGYTKRQLNKALRDNDYGGSKFLESMRAEVLNCGSHMNALTFFVEMTLEECLDLNESIRAENANRIEDPLNNVKAKPGKGYIVLKKDTPCGLYDAWSGAGSILELKLDRDVKLPLKHIDSAMPDGCRGYAVGGVYGMCTSFWKPGLIKSRYYAA